MMDGEPMELFEDGRDVIKFMTRGCEACNNILNTLWPFDVIIRKPSQHCIAVVETR